MAQCPLREVACLVERSGKNALSTADSIIYCHFALLAVAQLASPRKQIFKLKVAKFIGKLQSNKIPQKIFALF